MRMRKGRQEQWGGKNENEKKGERTEGRER
jgi:hypothetical protein